MVLDILHAVFLHLKYAFLSVRHGALGNTLLLQLDVGWLLADREECN